MDNVNKKSPDLLLLEECFKNIKAKENINGNLENISRILMRNFDINFSISVVNNTTNKFFGMNIFPTTNTIDEMIDAMIDRKATTDVIVNMWKKNALWNLEIDSILLFDTNLNTNPSEIVAVLLHEIGHIVYSNSIPQRVNRIMHFGIMNLSYAVKSLVKFNRVKKLFDLVVVEACSSKNFHYINSSTERVADQFVVKMGYGNELDNFINKLIATQGNSLVNRPENEIDTDVKSLVNWSIDNISELEFRKKKLKVSIEAELINNPSPYVRQIFDDIRTSFFGKDPDSYKEMVTEQYLIQSCKKIVTESILDIFDNIGKVKKIAQSDLDFISINISKMQNNDDKIYNLDLIYDKLDLINSALELIGQGKSEKVSQSKQTLVGFQTQLEKMRQQILTTDLPEKQYGVFIKYPKGYEG